MPRNEELFNAIAKGNRKAVEQIVRQAVEAGGDVVELMNGTMIPAMRDLGERFSRNEVYVPEMLIGARAMQTGLNLIEPILAQKGHKPRGRVCIGTVKGDLHDIGKNLVAMMLKGAGYQVDDLGVDCDVTKFDRAAAGGAQAALCSALLTTTMPYMKAIVEHLKGSTKIPVIVGGAPLTQEYADEIGADGYGADANEALKVVEKCLAATL